VLIALAVLPLVMGPAPVPASDDVKALEAELTALIAWRGESIAIERSNTPGQCAALFSEMEHLSVVRLDFLLVSGDRKTKESACVFADASNGRQSWQIVPRRVLDKRNASPPSD